ncbi:MAG: RNA polymerase sigma factor, partial [Candidatus Hydrogenedentes bacterium]|nr:RNA polymerase sigma factor [Candidatus Hydrogenedentota bacterium]
MLILAPSNAALVRQVLRGRRERFDVLVRRHLSAVYAVAFSFTTNHADAEDVSQDAFLKAYTSLDTLREPAKFEGWLIAIARNSALRAVKKHQRDKEREQEAQVPAAVRTVDPAREELYDLLGEKMEALDEPHREVLMLHYFAGKRTREIAGLLDVSQAAVLKRLQRAREALGGEMIEEIVGSRAETGWVNARSKEHR